MHNNIDLTSETYEDMGKLRIRRFQPLMHSGLTTVLREKSLNIYEYQ